MKRIFIINNYAHDYSPAKKFFDEEVEFINLTTGVIIPFKTDRLLKFFEENWKSLTSALKKII